MVSLMAFASSFWSSKRLSVLGSKLATGAHCDTVARFIKQLIVNSISLLFLLDHDRMISICNFTIHMPFIVDGVLDFG